MNFNRNGVIEWIDGFTKSSYFPQAVFLLGFIWMVPVYHGMIGAPTAFLLWAGPLTGSFLISAERARKAENAN